MEARSGSFIFGLARSLMLSKEKVKESDFDGGMV